MHWIVKREGMPLAVFPSRAGGTLLVSDAGQGLEASLFSTWKRADEVARGLRLLQPGYVFSVHSLIADELSGKPLSAAEVARAAGPDAVPMGGAMRHAPGCALGPPMDIQAIVASNAGGPV